MDNNQLITKKLLLHLFKHPKFYFIFLKGKKEDLSLFLGVSMWLGNWSPKEIKGVSGLVNACELWLCFWIAGLIERLMLLTSREHLFGERGVKKQCVSQLI